MGLKWERECEVVSKIVRVLFAIGEAIGSSFGTRVARLMFRFFVFICFACHHHKFLSPSWQFNWQYCTTHFPKTEQASVAVSRQLPDATRFYRHSVVSMKTHSHTHLLLIVCVYTGVCLFFDSVMTFRPFFLQVLLLVLFLRVLSLFPFAEFSLARLS